jgi:hypothetical protein
MRWPGRKEGLVKVIWAVIIGVTTQSQMTESKASTSFSLILIFELFLCSTCTCPVPATHTPQVAAYNTDAQKRKKLTAKKVIRVSPFGSK